MKHSETAALLGVIQTFDHRTVGEPDVLAWADVLSDLDAQDCIEAVRDHFRRTDGWLMPSHIRDYCDRKRRDEVERRHAAQLHADYVAGQAAIERRPA